MASNAPIATVYVHNLEERIKPEPLCEALRAIFSEFGTIVDIVAKTNLKAKGQAFIVYESPESAQRAVEETQGFPLFEKPMVVALARSRSDATVLRQGTAEEFEVHKRHRQAERDKKKAREAAEEQKKILQRQAAGGAPGAGAGAAAGSAPAVVPDEYLPPNKTLFVQNLPEDCDVDKLTEIFGRFEGFREVRMVPGRRGLAFVEYEAEPGAITAKENTAGQVVGDSDKRPMKVTYQRQ